VFAFYSITEFLNYGHKALELFDVQYWNKMRLVSTKKVMRAKEREKIDHIQSPIDIVHS